MKTHWLSADRIGRAVRRSAMAGCMGWACAGCQGLPPLKKPPAAHALAPVHIADLTTSSPDRAGMSRGSSRVTPIESGPEAFAARVAMARFAKQSLDMQYYIWDGDQTGTYLLGEMLDAADRGVRVRLLLDDNYSRGIIGGILSQLAGGVRSITSDVEDGLTLVTPDQLRRRDRMRNLMDEISSGGRDLVAAALDTHPRIEVRMFNPIPSRSQGSLGRIVQMVAHFSRLNRRMHNKIYAVDNQLAIVGGRNIADNYFGLHEERNVRDLDLMVSGPVVQDVSANFDLYWNSQWAVPVHAFTWRNRSEQRLAALRKELNEVFDRRKDPSGGHLDSDDAARRALRDLNSRMVGAHVVVIADVPEKFTGSGAPLVSEALGGLSDESRSEILVESAYFVPASSTFSRMEQRLSDGVAIRTLTNSLASTDQVAAQAGYFKKRRGLLKSGVEMYELRTFGKNTSIFGFLTEGSRAGVHTKAVVFDRRKVFVGTYNLDPRSADLNTEIGLLVDDPVVAREVAAFIDGGMQPQRSWRVSMGDPRMPHPSHKGGGICWCADDPVHPVILRREPEAPFVSRILVRLLSWLPIDRYL